MNTTKEHAAALRRAGRNQVLADLRDGRKQRSTRINSAKRYNRKVKHAGRGEA